MRVVIQRVTSASVTIAGKEHAHISHGLVVLVGAGQEDDDKAVSWMAGKVAKLRIFTDENGKMARSVTDVGGSILVVSQFTLFADTLAGNRPSFFAAMAPEPAAILYEQFVSEVGAVAQVPVVCGVFGADMQVALVNDGPVTICIDSRQQPSRD